MLKSPHAQLRPQSHCYVCVTAFLVEASAHTPALSSKEAGLGCLTQKQATSPGPSSVTAASQMGVGSGPICSTLDSVPCYCAWESSAKWPEDLEPRHPCGRLDGFPSSWLQLGPALAFAVSWGVDQLMEDLSLKSLNSNVAG